MWNCEPVVLSATDTFILDDNFKFIRQNIVIRTAKAPASQSVQVLLHVNVRVHAQPTRAVIANQSSPTLRLSARTGFE